MKFRGFKALRSEFPKGPVVQVRILTALNNWIEVEGPVTEAEVTEIVRLAIGPTAPNESEGET